jgi:hypothetical protein
MLRTKNDVLTYFVRWLEAVQGFIGVVVRCTRSNPDS